MFKDNFNLAFKNIKERLSRSILTLLGIAIGIMAIISLMGIGEGMNVAVTGELSSLSDTVLVNVGEGFSIFSMGSQDNNGEFLTQRDISDIERITGVKEVTTQLTGGGILTYNGQDTAVTLTGIESEMMQVQYSMEGLESGRLLEEADQNMVIIGSKVAHDYFDNEIYVGGRVHINGQKFFIAGVFGEEGAGLTSTDDIVLLSPRDFKKVTGESNIHSATVTVYDVNTVEAIASEIEQAINENHGDDDFASATTMSSILESIQMVLGIIQTVLVAIASIALVVASIGIMNTMLTSVMERTREIGIMKAIGATNKDIMVIFILEGMLLSIAGGSIGILLGVLGSRGVTAVLGNIGGPPGSGSLQPVISLTAVVLAVGVSMIVGIFSSLYPARKAAKMSPIEAVRYE